ncbi:MAG: DNA/RNA nuclease SfsA [Desulfobacterales bacterium]|nr:DNA/RNA nuclease SfsA [Desulfobacterales bacterium]
MIYSYSQHTYKLLFPELISGLLIKRYKRFLADVMLDDGNIVTAHCPNTGSMTECSQPFRRVYLSKAENTKRKLKYTWELIEMPSSMVGVNTQIPNILIFQSIQNKRIKELNGYDFCKKEVKSNDGIRIDILLTSKIKEQCFIEIKNCSLVKENIAYFPDALTKRGLKHLIELERLASEGSRSIIFYLVQRMDAKSFRPADHIDPEYGKKLREVLSKGVEILIYDVDIDSNGVSLRNQLPYFL